MAPATRPAIPLSKIVAWLAWPAATPTIKLDVDTIPSLAPNTLARSQLVRLSWCRSRWRRRIQALPIGRLLASSGLWTEKVPEYEPEQGQQDDQNGPKHFASRIRRTLKDVHDRPDIGDQNDQTAQTLILHAAPCFVVTGPNATRLRTVEFKCNTFDVSFGHAVCEDGISACRLDLAG
jgi:hypothetical protein